MLFKRQKNLYLKPPLTKEKHITTEWYIRHSFYTKYKIQTILNNLENSTMSLYYDVSSLTRIFRELNVKNNLRIYDSFHFFLDSLFFRNLLSPSEIVLYHGLFVMYNNTKYLNLTVFL